jgi:D-alanyl-D-alanine carboxypeptidase
VTIKQLLNMTSGIGDFFGERYQATPKNQLRKLADFLPLFAGNPLLFEPGTKRQYSNGGFVVLGIIIEKASGENYYDYIREHIYKPAGMMNTDSYEQDAIVPNRATGYTRKLGPALDGGRRNNIYSLPARASSAGGGYSTAEDLLKFSVALQDNRLIKPETRSRVFGGPTEPAKVAGQPQRGGFGFAGGAPGVNAEVEVDLGSGYTVVVMSNYDPPSAEKIGRQIRTWTAARGRASPDRSGLKAR